MGRGLAHGPVCNRYVYPGNAHLKGRSLREFRGSISGGPVPGVTQHLAYRWKWHSGGILRWTGAGMHRDFLNRLDYGASSLDFTPTPGPLSATRSYVGIYHGKTHNAENQVSEFRWNRLLLCNEKEPAEPD